MNVKLISITQSMIAEPMTKISSAEALIAYIARVSNPAGQMNDGTAPKLLAYLIKNKHWSPFEMVSMTVEIKTSRAICAQILRHRSFSFQEFSQRYSRATEFITYPARRQDAKNRQNSIDDLSEATKSYFEILQEEVQELAAKNYATALELDIAKEQARYLLPLSTATTLYMSGSARSWITYFLVRLEKSTQLEHREIAKACFSIFSTQFPCSTEALKVVYPEIFNET